LDCTYLVKHLKERLEEDEELEYDVQYGDDGAPETVFLVIKGGQEVWSNIDSQVILYDTKHGTNRYGMNRTIGQNLQLLVANYKTLAEVIARSHNNTNTEISLVKERIINATESIKSQVGKRTSSELGPNNEIVPNPPTDKKQRQKRIQPSAIGAPTTKANKTASRGSKHNQKKTEKAKLNDMMMMGR